MRGEPKRLSRNYLRKNGGNVILYVLVSFHTGYLFCTLSCLFVRSGFRLFFCSFGSSWFCCLFGFRGLNYANFSGNGNGNGNECVGCISVRYNSLFISLLLFTQVHKTTTWNRHISSAFLRERELNDGHFLKFLWSNFEAVFHILFGMFLAV